MKIDMKNEWEVVFPAPERAIPIKWSSWNVRFTPESGHQCTPADHPHNRLICHPPTHERSSMRDSTELTVNLDRSVQAA